MPIIIINYSFSTALKQCVYIKPNSFHTAQSTTRVAILHLSLPSVSRYMQCQGVEFHRTPKEPINILVSFSEFEIQTVLT